MKLESLLRPRSIAVVGGNLDEATWGGRVTRLLRRLAPSVEVSLVNRRHQEIEGFTCVSSMADLSAHIDQALIAAPAAGVPQLIRDCADAGIPSAVVFSSGFGESIADGAADLERELREAIAETGVLVLGPNCLGYNVVLENGELLAATSTSVLDVVSEEDLPVTPSRVLIVTQSGGVGAMSQGHLIRMGCWPAAVVHTGNEYGVRYDEVVRAYIDDASTQTVGVYLEGVADADVFEQLAIDLRDAGKQLVAMVGGRSRAGGRAVQSHSGRLVADGSALELFMARLGVPLARDMHQFALSLATAPPMRAIGNRLAIVTASGGFGTLTADIASDRGYAVPELGPNTQTVLHGVMPSYASSRNPVDVTGMVFRAPSLLSAALSAVASDDDIDAVVVTLGAMERDADAIVSGLLGAVGQQADVPVFVLWPHGPADAITTLRRSGVATMETAAELVGALDMRRGMQPPMRTTRAPSPRDDVDAAASTLRHGVETGLGASEALAKDVLGALRLRTPDRTVVTDRDEAMATFHRLASPVVMKGHGSALVHKAELGLVELGISTIEDAGNAFERLAERLHDLGHPVAVLVEEHVEVRRELLAGWSRTALGDVFLFGSGGAGAEDLLDVTASMGPVDHTTAMEMVQATVAGRALAVQQPAALGDVVAGLVSIAALAERCADLPVDLDVNPIAVTPRGEVRVLDACFSHSPPASQRPDRSPDRLRA